MLDSFFGTLRDGQRYMNDWPLQRELYLLFPEARVITATRFAVRWMPPAAILCAAVMLQVNGSEYIPQSLTLALFFLSLPLQGLLWLGHRSNQVLPPSIKAWYQEIHSKMREHGCEVAITRSTPRYRELALLLKKAFKELDRAFTKQWF